ncbi:hypothetical protein QBC35DRAFT_93211 [Podospora australis]|uniref:Uncharacterized protein n=1 Tax=Podospora australis TaxID=1536484 RepID=A0AAN6WNT7_9PEZI|nr:hypothetical protein QBC35DRAFT_93211 [Podospora australis]
MTSTPPSHPKELELSLSAVAMLTPPVIAACFLHYRCCMQTRYQSILTCIADIQTWPELVKPTFDAWPVTNGQRSRPMILGLMVAGFTGLGPGGLFLTENDRNMLPCPMVLLFKHLHTGSGRRSRGELQVGVAKATFKRSLTKPGMRNSTTHHTNTWEHQATSLVYTHGG